MQSLTAEPSFRNSGLEATVNCKFVRLVFVKTSVIQFDTLSAVPTGTVDLLIIILLLVICVAIVFATANTYCKSAEPSSSGGVPTAIKNISLLIIASFASVVNFKRPA